MEGKSIWPILLFSYFLTALNNFKKKADRANKELMNHILINK